MESFDIDNVKVEKANAMKRYQRLEKIANFFRFFEICLVLFLFSWFSTRLPSVFRIFERYFRQLCVVVISPGFVFLIGNVIVLTLFAKSGKFSDQDSVSDNAETDLYEEFVKKTEKNRMEATVLVTEEIVYEDKQTVYEEKSKYPVTVKVDAVPVKIEVDEPMKIYRRSKSVNSKREIIGKSKRELRRSETEIRRKSDVTGERGQVQVEGESYSEAMSNEEFQRTIEAFIAKQVRFHQEESKAIVLQ